MSTVLATTSTKFLVSAGALLRAAQLAQLITARNPVVPVLENLLLNISVENGYSSLQVSSSDLTCSFTSRSLPLERKDKQPASLCVPGAQLASLLKQLPDQPLTLSFFPEGNEVSKYPSLGISAVTYMSQEANETASAHYDISGEPGGDFPQAISLGEIQTEVTIPGHLLHAAFSHTLPVVSTDELRPAMTGILVVLGENSIEFAATDGHRLVRYIRDDEHKLKGKSLSLILPRRGAELLTKLVSQRENVKVRVGKTYAQFEMERGTLDVRLIEERYPDYNNVIPADNPNVLVVHRAEMLAAVKRVALFSNKTTYQVALTLSESGCQMKGEDLDFSNRAVEAVPGTYQGPDMTIGFNSRFLRFFLEKMQCQRVRFSMSHPSRAAVLTSADADGGLMCLLMPVMINHHA